MLTKRIVGVRIFTEEFQYIHLSFKKKSGILNMSMYSVTYSSNVQNYCRCLL